jgi:cytochrome c553
MKNALKALAWTGAAAAGAAVLLVQAQSAIEIDPESLQGRTESAIAEFRAAVALEPNLAHGAELFRSCAACHGDSGGGTDDGAVPVIAGQHVSVLVKQLVDFRYDRRWSERMQDAAKQHELAGPQDLLDVAGYAESLRRPPPRTGGDALPLDGQRVYYRDCEVCHGRLGEGELRRLRPRLAGQHYRYLVKELNETATGERPGMDPEHVRLIGALSGAERAAVANYLSRLSPGFSSEKPASPP